ncbi:MAG TPA: HAD-IA family hydrolase [Actinocrinis sp.]|nr:HAD-IA family hydrolase [Actinocrinis sp.]
MTDLSRRPAWRAQALLFDMDGTLVDSGAVVDRTWRRFAVRHGLDGDEVVSAAQGRRSIDTVTRFVAPGVDAAAEAARTLAEEIEDLDGIVALPGARELLATVPAGRWAMVTSAPRDLAVGRMAAAGLPLPGVVITAEDVRHGKPHPEGYLAAAARLGVAADAAVVFEDTDAGLAAAGSAGALQVAVGSANTASAQGLLQITDYSDVAVAVAADGWLTMVLPPQVSARRFAEPVA